MSPYTKEQTTALLEKVERHLVQDKAFTTDDYTMLHAMIQAWRGWLALRTGAKWVITTLGLVAALVASVGVIGSALKGFLK